MPNGSWRLSLFGVPQLRAPDAHLVRCEGKPLALLTYLALEGRVARARLADLLWPGVGETTGRNNLVMLLRRLRHSAGAELWQPGDSLSLRPEVEVDVRALLAGTARLSPELFEAGPLLEGAAWPELEEFSEWLLGWREWLDALRARLALDEARTREQAGQFLPAQQAAAWALRLDPVSEDAHRARMRLAYLAGDRAAALQAYQHCQDTLQERLNTAPLPMTQALARLIERGGQLPQLPEVPAPLPRTLHPSVLVGREAAWAAMEAAWQRGQTILVVGEAGAGKSRLATEFAASKGCTLLLEGRPGDASVPYAAAIRHLRRALGSGAPQLGEAALRSLSRLLPELGDQPDSGEGADARLKHSIAQVLAGARQEKAAVLYDDLQYTDDASIEVSGLLAPQQDGPGILVCYRRGELARPHEDALATLVTAGRAVRIELEGLSAAEVGTLLASAGLPESALLGEQLVHVTGGNPMFVLEAARHLQEAGQQRALLNAVAVPPRLEQMVLARLDRLAGAALPVARAASVLQQSFTPEQVAELLGVPLLEAGAAWDELERAEILRGERFSHDLLAEAVYRGMPPVVRRLLHRAAARLLERQHAPAARVARHWLDGGSQPEAAQWLIQAGAAARATFRPREAEGFYEQAVQLYDALGQPDDAFEGLIGQVAMLHEMEDARSRQATLIQALKARARTPVQRATAHRQAAAWLFMQNDVAGMEREVRAGLALVEESGNLALEAELYETLAALMLVSRRPDEAAAALRQMLRISEQTGDVTRQAISYDGLGQVSGYTSPEEALRLFRHAESLCLQIRDLPQASAIVTKQARMQQKLGDFRGALGTAERALKYLDAQDSYHARQLINVYFRTLCWQALGEHAHALAQIDAAQRVHAVSESMWLDALEMQRVRLLLDLGQVEQAHRVSERVMASARLAASLQIDRASMWAAVLVTLRRTGEALSVLDEAQTLLDSYPDVYLRPRLHLERAALLAPSEARPQLEMALEDAAATGLRGVALAAQARLAQTQLALGLPVLLPDDGDPDAVVSRGELLRTRAQVLTHLNDARAPDAWAAADRWKQERLQTLAPADRAAFLGGPLARQLGMEAKKPV
ncbi:ATP-binding protein [Deinococcus ruber]|uniref:Transcriptional activator n=1 Tax=Deinococcus ruber TaxID=1848197 RepID=A0A918FCP6_9DEIO|nr:AAA family ATPase [Deinococcus ruber]GGR30879.1 transcriptional activator [Deinococcus ruber]